MHLQPILSNSLVEIIPLQENDFNDLFNIAKDELLWEQHPNKDRYKKKVFEDFFKNAISSKGACKIIDLVTNKAIGSSRFYELKPNKSVAIGYTFIARSHWGTTYNNAIKELMINYAFQFVETIVFHVGGNNFRSQKAVEKLGAIKINNRMSEENFIYELSREIWTTKQLK
jgi:RimJ/RimL family protein N-acetyltransferase